MYKGQGLRSDGNSFTNDGNNLLNTLSPRLSMSYRLLPKWNINASVGDYYKIPTYTVLGFQKNEGEYVNRGSKYIRSTHYVGGFEYMPKEDLRFTVEGFFKRYSNYPVSVANGISLANLGGGFDILGNEAIVSNGGGETYGMEFYFQQKLVKRIFAVFSYTFVRSRFSGSNGALVASSWDNRHLVSALLGWQLKRGWEIGAKFRFAGCSLYTPLDTTDHVSDTPPTPRTAGPPPCWPRPRSSTFTTPTAPGPTPAAAPPFPTPKSRRSWPRFPPSTPPPRAPGSRSSRTNPPRPPALGWSVSSGPSSPARSGRSTSQ